MNVTPTNSQPDSEMLDVSCADCSQQDILDVVKESVMAQFHLVRCRTDKKKWNELIKLINDIDWFEKVLIPSHLVHPVATTVSVHYLIKKNAPMNVFKALLSKHPTPQKLCDELATGGNTPLYQFLQKINLWPPLEQIEIFKLLKKAYPDALCVLNSDLMLPCSLPAALGTLPHIVHLTDKRLEYNSWRSIVDALTICCRRLSTKPSGHPLLQGIDAGLMLFVRVYNNFRFTLQHALCRHLLSYVPATHSTRHEGGQHPTTTGHIMAKLGRMGERSREWALEEQFEASSVKVGEVGSFRKRVKSDDWMED